MMWPVRNPMARNRPISCTRSLTDAVMAKKMIMPATIRSSAEMPSENLWK